jgi:MoxR-like ATPase
MLTDSRDEYEDTVPDELKIAEAEYQRWQGEIAAVRLPRPVLELLSRVRRRLARPSDEGTSPIYVSDRRWKKVARLLRTSAFLNGRQEVSARDLGLLRHCLWDRPEDIDYVSSVLGDELARFDFGEEVDPRAAARELGALKRRIREATVETVEEESFEPVLYRGEYVRLEGLEESRVALMWRGDWDALDTEQGARCEIFLFDEDITFSETRIFEDVRRCSEPAIRVDGRRYPVEHRRVRSTSAQTREPAEGERRAWLEEASAISNRCRAAADRAVLWKQEAAAEPHLFVEEAFSQTALSGLDLAASEFEQLRLVAERLVTQLSSRT